MFYFYSLFTLCIIKINNQKLKKKYSSKQYSLFYNTINRLKVKTKLNWNLRKVKQLRLQANKVVIFISK